jgi:uncharacterized repeat protein (TIGR03803 family)
MSNRRFRRKIVPVMLLMVGAIASSGFAADHEKFSTLYKFDAAEPNTFASPLGSQPDTRPVLGPGNAVYGMTSTGGTNGNGVIYRFDLESRQYTLLHTFSAVDANGDNEDGAVPGVALTRGGDDVFYGVASFGGANGNGTVFKINASGEFKILHTFSALDANGNNEDGANPLRTVEIGNNGKLYGTTRLGGGNTCGATHGCGVAWLMDRSGASFQVSQTNATALIATNPWSRRKPACSMARLDTAGQTVTASFFVILFLFRTWLRLCTISVL